MLKQKLILTVFALATLFVACHDDEAVETVVTYPVELSISFPDKEQEFRYQGWNENREIAALRTDTRYADKLVLSSSDGQNYVAASEKEITDYTEFAFLYPASASTVSSSDTLTQVLYIDRQNGTLDGLADFDYAWGTYTYDTDEDDSVSTSVLKPLMSFCRFGFMHDGSPLKRISQVIITSPTDSIHAVGSLNLTDGYITRQNRGSIVLQNSQGLAGEVYAALFPTETALHFTVTTLDGKSYEAILPDVTKFKAGESFVYSDIACTELAPARIGDYYYNDATWSSLLDESKTCVGIVYAEGRAVAVRDAVEEVTWSITSEDLEGISNQTVLQDTMYIGSLPYWDGTPDSFFSDDVSEKLDGVKINLSTGEITAWYSQGALSDFEGQKNTSEILGSSGTYYASTGCRNYGQGLYGWYLPSAGELALLWSLHRAGIICSKTHDGFEDFKPFGYWTSTEYDEGNVWYINFWSGMMTKNSKASSYNVRPVIRF